ncbi:uncharacterized protein BT62DRAFT_961109 [Guyanagaster necrorhizus]|uniref:PX domain-containing protein n=1 Tax=Guyanagaster necrorhizus TaxID=856835 RepID=A0A9P7W259_9AGAR|nr:uncharacterized protein BT62DRAFT_961109 [Guyanagaster necrorhizus MCA 3950]KAG7451333.1 hypothetical protein BT62DRAFT_961109 [Guyanagaster necrorhizus MCA 3950]
MLDANHFGGVGSEHGPSPTDNYKRAVYRQPPTRFSVEMLTPTKQGGSYSFGMRICPITRGDRSSISSDGSNSEYDIWRRWEDWLWFQDIVEEQYRLQARAKRQRLLAGKGVKKDGFYKQDMASSWESLPPGPDPHSVAQDVHELIPKLTKKGTLFRASQATIDQRFAEIQAFAKALFRDDVPILLLDLRSERIVTDFFGLWRRDYDLAQKIEKQTRSKSRSPKTDSILSNYFSNASLPSVDTPSRRSMDSVSRKSFTSSSVNASIQNFKYGASISRTSVSSLSPPIVVERRRRESSVSSDSSSTLTATSSRSSGGSLHSVPSIAEETSVSFGHNPQISDQASPYLEALPEDREISSKSNYRGNSTVFSPAHQSALERKSRRSVQVIGVPKDFTQDMEALNLNEEQPRNRAVRESWQTMMSGASIIDGIGLTMPFSPEDASQRSRSSVASFATFMTDSSADAIIPRSTIPRPISGATVRRHPCYNQLSSALSEGDMWLDPEGDLLDTYFRDAFQRPDSLISRSYGGSRSHGTIGYHSSGARSLESIDFIMPSEADDNCDNTSTLDVPMTARPVLPPSPTASMFSTVTSASAASALSDMTTDTPISPTAPITVKAAYNGSIVIFRGTRDVPFSDVRYRIRDKFIRQENIWLSDFFALAIVVTDESASAGIRNRSSSLSSICDMDMKLISTPDEWRWVMSYVKSSKITLRVLGNYS